MVPFKYGTQEQYDAQVKNNSALYFISDTKRIYRGEELIAGVTAEVVDALPSFTSAVSGILYVLVQGDFAKLYVKGDTSLVPLISEVEDQGIKGIEAFDPAMILTSEGSLEDADDSMLMTAGAIKAAIDAATGTWEYLDGTSDTSRIYG